MSDMKVQLKYHSVLDRQFGKNLTTIAICLDDPTATPLVCQIQDDQITWSADGERTILVPFAVALHLGFLTDGTQDSRDVSVPVWAIRRLIDAASSGAPNSKEKTHMILDWWLRENHAVV